MEKRNSFTDFKGIKKDYESRLNKLYQRDLKDIFSKRFKEQKEQKGLSISQLSTLLSVSKSTIDKWLGGASMPKNIEKLLQVCALFDKPLRYFTGEIDITVSEIAESNGLPALEDHVLNNLIELMAYLDSFGAGNFSDYRFTVNKLLGSKELLRAVFEYIIISNNHSVNAFFSAEFSARNAVKHFSGADALKIDGIEVDRAFLKQIGIEKIKRALDKLAAESPVYSELAVIDINSLYDDSRGIVNLPFPIE